MATDLDDDCPPSLQSLAQQVQAVKITAGGKESGQLAGADVQVASTTVIGAPKAPAALRRGFFDAKPSAGPKKRAAGTASAANPGSTSGPDITVVRAKQRDAGGGPSIPDFMRLPPDEQQERYQALKSNMVKALQPTPDMVQQVAKDKTLMAGFDDPEVMAAVSEVARDPAAIQKYRNNRKVQAFYAAMGQFVGAKLEGGSSGGQAAANPAGPVQKQQSRQGAPSQQQRRAPQTILTRLPDADVD